MSSLVVVPYWSASRFMKFDECPANFREHYIDGVVTPPSEAMEFGSAVHDGLEAHFNGQDSERAFLASWKWRRHELPTPADSRLTGRGLDLIDRVIELDLHGVPERRIEVDTNAELGAPIIGAIDLLDLEHNIVYDFKTTRGAWSQKRAQKEAWQPLLYTYSIWEETGQWPAFEYIVLDRAQGTLSRFRREWTPEEWLEQMNALWVRMCEVSVAVAQGRLECTGKHGRCLECGERWSHDHVCDPAQAGRKAHIR